VFTANTAQMSNAKICKKAKAIMNVKRFSRFRSLLNWFENKQATTRSYVQIRIIEVTWLNEKIPEFYKYLAGSNRPGIYDNELIKVLLQQQNYTMQIVMITFLPYMVYMILILTYFM
jgi:hypothetical protein